MAMTPEGRVKHAARKMLKRYGVYSFAPVTGGFGVSGVFDLVACINGRFLGIEFKSDDGKRPTALQIGNAMRCMAAGGVALLIHKDNLDVLERVVRVMQENTAADMSHSLSDWPYTTLPGENISEK